MSIQRFQPEAESAKNSERLPENLRRLRYTWIMFLSFALTLLASSHLGAQTADRTTCFLPLSSTSQTTQALPGNHQTPEIRFGVDVPGWQNYIRVWRAHHADPSNIEIRKFLSLPLSTRGESLVGFRAARGRSAPRWIGWRPGTYAQVDTPHLTIYSRASREQSQRVAEDLERCYWVWTQMFFPLWEARGQATALLAQLKPDQDVSEFLADSNKRITIRRKLRIVLFRDVAEYQRELGKDIPGIERSTGFYNDERQTVFLYATKPGEEDDPATRRHEMIHQLFREATRSGLGSNIPGEDREFWLVEGIAGYFESLYFGPSHATVGGWDAERLQFARYRILANRDVLPLSELRTAGRLAAQKRDDLARWYAHAIAQTHSLMDGERDSQRRWIYKTLAELYKIKSDLPEESLTTNAEAELARFLVVDDGVLENNPCDREFRKLCLAHCQVTGKGLATLKKTSKIQWLDLSRMPITSQNVQDLVADPSTIDQLSLEATAVDDDLADWIAKAKNLRELDLSFTGVSDAAAQKIAARDLEVLWLTGSKVTDKSIPVLLKLSALQSLDVQRSEVSDAGLKTIRQQRPQLGLNPLQLR